MPFDIELGISKKFSSIPLQLSISAHHLHQFDISYNDTLYQASGKHNSADKILRHLIFSAQLTVGNNIEITAGYNYLRRNELKIISAGNGWTGFSIGVAAIFSQVQIRYARAYYQNNSAYNQLGINFNLKRRL